MQGKGFEFAVVSELLLRGYNCAPASVDAGVDVFLLSKSGVQVKIQVKGRNFRGRGTGVESFLFSKKSYCDTLTKPDFVILVVRNLIGKARRQPMNSYLIIPRNKFDELIKEGYVTKRENKLKLDAWAEFRQDGRVSKFVVQKGYGARKTGREITDYVNAWDLLSNIIT